jgi:hypothetical protein
MEMKIIHNKRLGLFCVLVTALLHSHIVAASVGIEFVIRDDNGRHTCMASRLSGNDRGLYTLNDSRCLIDVVDMAYGNLQFENASGLSRNCSLARISMNNKDQMVFQARGICIDYDFDNDGLPNRDDPDANVVESNDCTELNVLLPKRIFVNESFNCRARGSIDTGGNRVQVGSQAKVLYMAPVIRLREGFSVTAGGTFYAVGRSKYRIP